MRQPLKKSSTGILSFIALTLLVSACGGSAKRSLYVANPSTNQNVIPTLDPFANSSTNTNYTSIVPTISIAAVPSATASAGQTVYLIGSGTSGNLYNFQFQSNSIGASFVGSSQSVSNVGVTSATAGSVTITANSISGGYTSPGQITITFTGSTTSPYPGTYSACSIQGPYALSGYSNSQAQVGGSYYFSVLKPTTSYSYSEQLKIVNVWTPDSSEIGRYYYAWDKFWLTFNSGGQKTIYVRAQSLTTGTICDAQLSVYVSGGYVAPTPGPVPGGSCGIIPATGAQYCSLLATLTYYYDGNSCQSLWQSSSCGAKGPFSSLSACQSAVSAGQCGGSSGGSATRQVSVDSRSTQWMDTGVDVAPSAYGTTLTITASGQVNIGYGIYSGADGTGNTGYHACKNSQGQSFLNAALLGKIGTNGTPFLVGSSMSTTVNYSTGRLYLLVNDTNCASDNSGSLTTTIQTRMGSYPVYYQ